MRVWRTACADYADCGHGPREDVPDELSSTAQKQRLSITGVEINDRIVNEALLPNGKSVFSDNVKIIASDFFEVKHSEKYDLIIGNPPYFVIRKADVPQDIVPLIFGRPNIYTLFVVRCLGLLNPGGILAFILPKNFLTCGY